MAKKSKNKEKTKCTSCRYFLDHPQINREPSPGNGNSPGSLASMINFGGKGTSEATPKAPTTSTTASSGSSKPSIAEQINFGGKFSK